MTIIRDNLDLLYNLEIKKQNGESVNIQDINTLSIHVYTTGTTELIYSKEDFQDNKLRIPSTDLAGLEDGQIKIEINYSILDPLFPDHKEDISQKYSLNKILQHTAQPDESKKDFYYTKEQVDNLINDVFGAQIVKPEDLSIYLTEIPAEYITEDELEAKHYLTEHQSLVDYAKKADLNDYQPKGNYLTEHQSLAEYAKKADIPTDYVNDLQLNDYALKTDLNDYQPKGDYLTEHQSLDDYAKKADLNDYQPKGNYLTEHQSLAEYAKKADIPTDYVNDLQLNDYALKTDLNDYQPKGDYLTEHQSLDDYALKSEIPTDYVNPSKLNDYALKTDLNDYLPKGDYLTEHQSLADYAKKTDIPTDYVNDLQLNDYALKTDLNDYQPKGNYLTEHQSLDDYALKTDIPTDYVNDSQLNDYYTKTEVDDLLSNSASGDDFDANNYYTKDEIDNNPWGYVDLSSLSGEISSLQNAISDLDLYKLNNDALNEYYTKYEADDIFLPKGDYLTEHQSLDDYALKTDIPTDYVNDLQLNDYALKTDLNDYLLKGDYALKTDIPTDYVTSSELDSYYTKTDADDTFVKYVDDKNVYSKGIFYEDDEANLLFKHHGIDINGDLMKFHKISGEYIFSATTFGEENEVFRINKDDGAYFLGDKLATEDYVNDKIDDIELYKFPNATIYGAPTINNGQISSFSADDYLMFPFVVDFLNRPYEIKICFATGTDVTSQHNIFDSAFGLAFAIRDNRFIIAVSTNGTSWQAEYHGSNTINPSTTYYVKLTWDGTTFREAYSLDDTIYNTDIEEMISDAPYPKQIIIGRSLDGRHTFNGIINLNYCSLTISNKLIWTGMDDVGMATRLALDLGNIDYAGELKIRDIVGPIPEIPNLDEYVTQSSLEGNYYNKNEVDDLLSNIGGGDFNPDDYYDKNTIDNNYYTSGLVDDLFNKIIWEGTQAQYDALSDKTQYKIYTIIE